MSASESLTVTISAELAATVRTMVADGNYASASEVVGEALHAWASGRAPADDDMAGLRDAIRRGLDSGPGIPAQQVFDELRARYAPVP